MMREMGCSIVFSSISSQSGTNSFGTWSPYSKQSTSVLGYFEVTVLM